MSKLFSFLTCGTCERLSPKTAVRCVWCSQPIRVAVSARRAAPAPHRGGTL